MNMVVLGRVHNGVIVLDGEVALPEGAVVTVSCLEPPAKSTAGTARIEIPLIKTGRPGTVQLSSERIAQILDEEDAAS